MKKSVLLTFFWLTTLLGQGCSSSMTPTAPAPISSSVALPSEPSDILLGDAASNPATVSEHSVSAAKTTSCGDKVPKQKEEGEFWPRSIDEAAEYIAGQLSLEDRKTVAATSRDGLIRFHHGWGTGIRNALGLWRNNDPLLADCGCTHPDECSMKIIEAVWEHVREAPKESLLPQPQFEDGP